MKRYTVITTFNEQGRKLYGQKMVNSFQNFWPREVDLVVYTEGTTVPIQSSNVRLVDLYANSKVYKQFLKRHKNNPQAQGGKGPNNEAKYDARKAFKWQGIRFCHKVFAVHHAVNTINTDWIIWLDGDTLTHTPVPMKFLDSVSPDEYVATHLGRGERYHSECGWVGYNRKHSQGIDFVNDFAGLYINDTMFNYPEWHDSFLFDVMRREYQQKGAKFFNLNPHPDTKGLAGHPFINSELGRYIDHMKGKRKILGYSKANEYQIHNNIDYVKRIPRVR
jgi:hypothetical protein